ncbi:hypothetical protein K469DRAFT_652322 [Zopfia rhizophila CBS 207.26]|uniref:RNI-like protein n=1 Tax=Zopfia rhizophila CBS 207.26 TaxID=1314779 RepID=A0A6A6EV54_9PEZI|nr:hypothetical protein K469DRAFT_652322 [Zopfia rhizophila CBS 207.26]
MTKLNYTKRRTDGLKLADTVAKDLVGLPESPPAPSEGLSPPLDLVLTGKKLTDGGLQLFTQELINGLTSPAAPPVQTPAFKLEAFDLAGNCLTAKSLPLLADVVRLTTFDLRTLNLSGNEIVINDDEAANIWEDFLDAFKRCRALTTLDFSGNPLGDQRPFEIFARVYLRHPPVDPNELHHPQVEDADQTESPSSSSKRKMSSPLSSTQSGRSENMTSGKNLKRRCGLRSVPYITINDTGLNDVGALWLSQLLTQHYLPQQLISSFKGGPVAACPDGNTLSNACCGLVYLPNNGLTENGRKLLSLAEDPRKDLLNFSTNLDNISEHREWEVMDNKQGTPTKRQLSDKRRTSGRLNETSEDENGSRKSAEFDSFRRRIERIIMDQSLNCELWVVSLKMLGIAREMVIKPYKPSPITQEAPMDGRIPIPVLTLRRNMMSVNVAHHLPRGTRADDTPSPFPIFDIKEESPEQVRADEKWTPKYLTARRRLSQKTLKKMDRYETDSGNVGELSQALWRYVSSIAAGAEQILVKSQKDRIMKWAARRENVVGEKGLLGKARSYQKWTLLDNIGCLAYEIEF